MEAMRRSLGRGLTQLFTQEPPIREKAKKKPSGAERKLADAQVQKPLKTKEAPEPPAAPVSAKDRDQEAVSSVAIANIHPNSRQPRARFDDESLKELAASILEVGILQPLIVRPHQGGFELIAGERRLRAAKLAGLANVPVIVRKEGGQKSLEIALIENVQREDITPLEAAKAFQRLIDEFSLTQEQVAVKVGKSRPAVANTVRLLRLPQRVQEGLESGAISEAHARALLGVSDPALQLALYERVVAKGMSVRDLEEAVRPGAPTKASGPKARRGDNPHWTALSSSLSERFGSPVKLQGSTSRGKLVIEFFSEDDLDRIVESLGIRL